MSQANPREEDEYIAVFQAFLEEHHKEDITSVLVADDPTGQYCVVVNVLELFDSNIEVSQKLLAAPNKMLPLFDGALAQAAVAIMQENATQISLSFKSHLHVRLSNLPICPELRRDKIPKTSDIGRFLALSGEMTGWDGVLGRWGGGEVGRGHHGLFDHPVLKQRLRALSIMSTTFVRNQMEKFVSVQTNRKTRTHLRRRAHFDRLNR